MLEPFETDASGTTLVSSNSMSLKLPSVKENIKRIVAYVWRPDDYFYSLNPQNVRVPKTTLPNEKGFVYSFDIAHLATNECVLHELQVNLSRDIALKLQNLGIQTGNTTETINLKIISIVGDPVGHEGFSEYPQMIREVYYEEDPLYRLSNKVSNFITDNS